MRKKFMYSSGDWEFDKDSRIISQKKDGRPVAAVTDTGLVNKNKQWKITQKEAEANGRLISESPAMFRLLLSLNMRHESTCSFWNSDHFDCDCGVVELYNERDRIVQKVKGD